MLRRLPSVQHFFNTPVAHNNRKLPGYLNIVEKKDSPSDTLTPKRPRRPIWRAVRFCLFGFVILVIATGAGLFYILANGEDLEWVRARLEAAINERAAGAFTVRLDTVSLDFSADGGGTLKVAGLALESADEALSIDARSVNVTPNWSALLKRRLEVATVRLNGASVRIVERDQPDVVVEPEQAELTLFEVSQINRQSNSFMASAG
ncbi:MAG: hypothetical protein AAFW47_08360, partial [Pseudomonadota bacterium]